LPGRKKISARGVSRFQSFTLLLFCFILFLLASFYQKYKKISSFIVVIFYLPAFSFVRMGTPKNTKLCDFTSTKKNDFICTPIAPPAPEANFYEIKSSLLNLVMKEQFSGASTDDAAAHLNNFVELCEMQKYKDADGDIIKLKLFPFPLREELRIGCYLCLEIVLILGISVRMLLLENTICYSCDGARKELWRLVDVGAVCPCAW
jgi:hypothetical protein